MSPPHPGPTAMSCPEYSAGSCDTAHLLGVSSMHDTWDDEILVIIRDVFNTLTLGQWSS
jgi:hypothetical protein